MREEK